MVAVSGDSSCQGGESGSELEHFGERLMSSTTVLQQRIDKDRKQRDSRKAREVILETSQN